MALSGMTSVSDYPMYEDGAWQLRDYVLVTHLDGYVLVYDVTVLGQAKRVAEIPIGPVGERTAIAGLEVDRKSRRIYVTAFGNGVYVLDFDTLPKTSEGAVVTRLDANNDGLDDRVLEHIEIAGEDATSLAAVPELGLVWAGGRQRGLSRPHRPRTTT